MKLGFIGLSGHMNTYIVLYLNGIKFVASYVVFFFFVTRSFWILQRYKMDRGGPPEEMQDDTGVRSAV